jgi:hypothetical protein
LAWGFAGVEYVVGQVGRCGTHRIGCGWFDGCPVFLSCFSGLKLTPGDPVEKARIDVDVRTANPLSPARNYSIRNAVRFKDFKSGILKRKR